MTFLHPDFFTPHIFLQGICFVGVTTKTTTRVVVVLGLFFRKKRVVVVFRGSGCSGFPPDSADRPNPGNFRDLA